MFIKIKIEDVIKGNISTIITRELEDLLKPFGLNVIAGDDIGYKMSYQDIGEHRYLNLLILDNYNKGGKTRNYPPSKKETAVIKKFCLENGYEIVDSLPVSETDLI